MSKLIAVGAGAGLVSALLFAVVATGSPLAVLLCYAAPLPIVIVSLGWNHLVGLLAVAVGSLAVTACLSANAAMAFALGPAAPAWALCCLLLTRDPADDGRHAASAPVRYLSLGHVLVGIGVAGAFMSLASAVGIGGGDYAAFRDTLSAIAESLLKAQAGVPGDGAVPSVAGISGKKVVSLLVRTAPGIAGALFSLSLVFNLWLGARAVSVSGRMPRPWTPVSSVRMPPAAFLILGLSVLLTLFPGYAGVAGVTLLGALGMGFALQGLALLHHLSRGRAGRAGLLVVVYMLTFFFGGTFLPLMALAGMADSATPLRRRFSLAENVSGPQPDTRH